MIDHFGGMRSAPSTGWVWLDGSPETFTNWAANEPNDIDLTENGDQDCGVMHVQGDWDDDSCMTPTHSLACAR